MIAFRAYGNNIRVSECEVIGFGTGSADAGIEHRCMRSAGGNAEELALCATGAVVSGTTLNVATAEDAVENQFSTLTEYSPAALGTAVPE